MRHRPSPGQITLDACTLLCGALAYICMMLGGAVVVLFLSAFP